MIEPTRSPDGALQWVIPVKGGLHRLRVERFDDGTFFLLGADSAFDANAVVDLIEVLSAALKEAEGK